MEEYDVLIRRFKDLEERYRASQQQEDLEAGLHFAARNKYKALADAAAQVVEEITYLKLGTGETRYPI
jgi:hypothetical protein